MKKILITSVNYYKYCTNAIEMLKDHGCEVVINKLTRPLEFSELQNLIGDVDGIIAGNDKLDEQIYKIAKNLKVIARVGIGYDNVDISKAKDYGITVSNARADELSIGVAELAVGFMIDILRDIPRLSANIKSGDWERSIGREINGMTIGLIGFGAIGQMVAKRLSGFGVRVLAYDKYPNMEKAKELHVEIVTFEDALRNSDIVSLHVPNSKDNYHIIGEEQFTIMKDGAYFINTARGALVDEKALYKTLKAKKLTAAAIDVFEKEPVDPVNPLLTLDNIICTQHIGGETWETKIAVGMIAAQAVLDVFDGKKPKYALN